MSGTPLLDALLRLSEENRARFHMPGHKGRLSPPFDLISRIDYTELDGTGNLYTEDNGVIRQSEALTAELYGVTECMYLTGGATQGIFSMLASICKPGDCVLIDRASHSSVYHAMVMLDLHPIYLTRDILLPFGCGAGIELPLTITGNPVCMLITQPTYYGILSDTDKLSEFCEANGIPLLLDCAHGAHLPFVLQKWRLNASMAVFSAHKTLGALGQAAFLLLNKPNPLLRYMTKVFGTSSPSYPIMASIETACNMHTQWEETVQFGNMLRQKYKSILNTAHIDPARICLYTGHGYETALKMEKELGVICEMADDKNVVFILSSYDTPHMRRKLDDAIAKFSRYAVCPILSPPPPLPIRHLSPRQAFFSNRKTCPLKNAAGMTAWSPIAPYPPGIPLVAPGEKIEPEHIEILYELCYNKDDRVDVCV